MKPVVTVDKQPTKIRMNEGERNAIIPAKIRLPAAPKKSTAIAPAAIRIPTAKQQSSERIEQHNDNRTTNNNYQDNRRYFENHTHGDVTEEIYQDIRNEYSLFSASQHTHNNTTLVDEQVSIIDNSVTDNSTNITSTTNIDDHSQTWNIHNESYTFNSNAQTIWFVLFHGDGLEKVLMMLVALGILTVIFLTQMLVILGAVAVFIMGYLTMRHQWKQKKFKREMEEREKDRQHQLRMAEASRPVNVPVANADVQAQVAAQFNTAPPQQPPPPVFVASKASGSRPERPKRPVGRPRKQALTTAEAPRLHHRIGGVIKDEAKYQGSRFVKHSKEEIRHIFTGERKRRK